MHLVHGALQGIHMLHWLTVAVPLATLLAVSGIVRPKKTARLLLVGVAMTLATAALTSIDPEHALIRYGAPLPMVRAGFDPLTGELRTGFTLLRACFVANLLFWSSGALLLGALIQTLARTQPRRGPRRRY